MKFKDLDDILNLGNPIVLNFNLSYCPACKQFLPIFKVVGKKFKGKVKFVVVDAETCRDILDNLHISELPTIIFYKDRKIVYTHKGKMTEEHLTYKVEKLCNSQ